MNRREFLRGMTGGMLVGAAELLAQRTHTGKPPAARRRPNVVFICTDDMDFNEIGCYGGDQVLTPNIDRLANQGIRFDRYYVTSSVCTPSRYAALTGRYASRSESFVERNRDNPAPCIGWDTFLETNTPTIQSELRSHGYTTGFVGKWHLSPSSTTWRSVKNRPEITPDTLRIMQEEYARVTADIRQHGFDHVDGVYEQNLRAIAIPKKYECMNLDWKTACALDFIDANRDKPFFLYFATNAPHTTVAKKADWLVAEFRKDTRYTPNGVLPERPNVLKNRDRLLADIEARGLPNGGVIASWIDAAVGAIVDRLEALGLRDNTLVVFTSDHQSIGKFTCYEGSRCPCIVSAPPGAADTGRVSRALIANIDLAPTILEFCGIGPAPAFDGTSFLPVLQRDAERVRDALLLETACCRAVVTQDGWKYIAMRFPPAEMARIEAGTEFWTNGTGLKGYWRTNNETVAACPNMQQFDQLYDLSADPLERTNLYNRPECAGRQRALQQLLREQLARLPLAFAEFTG